MTRRDYHAARGPRVSRVTATWPRRGTDRRDGARPSAALASAARVADVQGHRGGAATPSARPRGRPVSAPGQASPAPLSPGSPLSEARRERGEDRHGDDAPGLQALGQQVGRGDQQRTAQLLEEMHPVSPRPRARGASWAGLLFDRAVRGRDAGALGRPGAAGLVRGRGHVRQPCGSWGHPHRGGGAAASGGAGGPLSEPAGSQTHRPDSSCA